jgi:hypothetical protein
VLQRWENNLFVSPLPRAANDTSNLFEIRQPATVGSDGSVELQIPVDSIVSLTTLLGGGKAALQSPPSTRFHSQHTDSFGSSDGYSVDQQPWFFSDQTGSFAMASSTTDGQLVLQQQVQASSSRAGVGWHNGDSEAALTFVGDYNISDTLVAVMARISGNAECMPTNVVTLQFAVYSTS